MQKAAKAYFQTQVATTSQGKLLLMLYDGCIKFLNQAKDKIQERDYAQKGILISKALDVINELDSSLNAEKGGDLAENLHKLYFYCSTRLLNANLKMNITYIDEVIKILTGLRSAYAQIIDTPEAIAATAMTAPVKAGLTNVEHGAPTPGGFPKPAAFGAKGPMPKANAFAMQAQTNAETATVPGSPSQGYGSANYARPMQTAQPGTVSPADTSHADSSGPAQLVTPPAAAQEAPQQTVMDKTRGPMTSYGNTSPAAPVSAKQAPAAPGVATPSPQPVENGSLDFSGKRLTGAAMYRKIASHNTP